MNCSELTENLIKIQELHREMGGLEGRFDVEGVLRVKKSIIREIDEIKAKHGPVEVFLDELKGADYWQKVAEKFRINDLSWSDQDEYEVAEESLGDLKFIKYIDSDSFMDFLNRLADDEIRFNLMAAITFHEEVYPPSERVTNFYRLLVNVFLNVVLTDEMTLTVTDLPDIFRNNFGEYLKRGTVVCDEVDVFAGDWMSGGHLMIGRSTGNCASNMRGGHFEVQDPQGAVGQFQLGGRIDVTGETRSLSHYASGGVVFAKNGGHYIGNDSGNIIVAEKAGDHLGAMKNSGVIIAHEAGRLLGRIGSLTDKNLESKATILVQNYDDREPEKSKLELYHYDDFDGRYHDLRGHRPNGVTRKIEPAVNQSFVDHFKERGCGLIIIEDWGGHSNIDMENLTESMADGIMVIKTLKARNLGRGMKKGVVIFEVAESPDKIKECIYPDYDRDNIVFLQRVPDSENKNKTRLVEVA